MDEPTDLSQVSSAGNYSRTSDIFRAFVALVRTKVDVFCQTVRAIIRVAMRATKTGLSTGLVRGSQLSVHVLLLAWQHVSLMSIQLFIVDFTCMCG